MAKVQVLVGTQWVEMSAPKTAADATRIAGQYGVEGGTFGFKTDRGECVSKGPVPKSERLELVEIVPDVEPESEPDS